MSTPLSVELPLLSQIIVTGHLSVVAAVKAQSSYRFVPLKALRRSKNSHQRAFLQWVVAVDLTDEIKKVQYE